MSLYRPTMEELKQLIETPGSYPWADIAVGDVVDKCDLYSDAYSTIFFHHRIDHVLLFGKEHSFLAVKTADQGVVIFDPTFRQFDRQHPTPYFLDTPAALNDWVRREGGPLAIAQYATDGSEITCKDAFLNHEAIDYMAPLVGKDPLTLARYAREWNEALAPIAAALEAEPWVDYVSESRRSSSEVSP